LNIQGGAERFTVDLIKVLKDHGYEVHLATFDKVDWNRVEENMGSCVKPDKCLSIFWRRPSVFRIYQRLLMPLAANRLAREVDVTINTHSDYLLCKTDIVYMHGAAAVPDGFELKVPWWKIPYVVPYQAIIWVASSLRRNPDDSIFIANSRHTAKKLLEHRDIRVDRVIYPPVHTEIYRKLAFQSERENVVLTVSRYSKEKDLDHILEIAKRTRGDIRFVVVGSAANRLESSLANELIDEARAHDFRVTFYVNLSQDAKREIMAKAKAYLHPGTFEHFGVAVCEAVSAGCLPVAVNEGGHLEILEPLGHIARCYKSFDEAAQCIESAVDSWNPDLAQLASRQMERFGIERFAQEILQVIQEFAAKSVVQH
jgi:glycosyltransferase involved in cell wall biosynthesis